MIAWYYLRPRPGRLRLDPSGLARVAVLLGVAILTASPWIVRNAVVIGTPQIRSNLGVEVFVGNNDGATGPFNGRIHPAYDPEEAQRYRSMGELAYSRDAMARGTAWIREHPGRFTRLTLERIQRFWLGPNPARPIVLGSGAELERDWMGWLKWLTHGLMGALAIAGAITWKGRPGSRTVMRGSLLLFPLVYYVTHVFERYRFPLEPLVTLSAAVLLLRLVRALRRRGAEPEGDPG
jgi:hypothetical protein